MSYSVLNLLADFNFLASLKTGKGIFVMASEVRFNFLDSRGRTTSRTVVHTSDVIATILADVAVLAPLWDALTDLELVDVIVSKRDNTDAFAGAAVSNIDENVSVQVLKANGYKADFNLPDMPDSFTPGGVIDPTALPITDFFAEFAAGNNWRLNIQNPQAISSVIKGVLDT